MFTVIRGTESFNTSETVRELVFPGSIYNDIPFSSMFTPSEMDWLGIENLGCTLVSPDPDDELLVTSVDWIGGDSWLESYILRVHYTLSSTSPEKDVKFQFVWMNQRLSDEDVIVRFIDYLGD